MQQKVQLHAVIAKMVNIQEVSKSTMQIKPEFTVSVYHHIAPALMAQISQEILLSHMSWSVLMLQVYKILSKLFTI